jgi:hypothetical protein
VPPPPPVYVHSNNRTCRVATIRRRARAVVAFSISTAPPASPSLLKAMAVSLSALVLFSSSSKARFLCAVDSAGAFLNFCATRTLLSLLSTPLVSPPRFLFEGGLSSPRLRPQQVRRKLSAPWPSQRNACSLLQLVSSAAASAFPVCPPDTSSPLLAPPQPPVENVCAAIFGALPWRRKN